MNVHLRHPLIPKRPWGGRGAEPALALAASTLTAPPLPSERERERDGDRPEDRALYHCHCGYVFHAAVSTSVGCPHCGSAQAW